MIFIIVKEVYLMQIMKFKLEDKFYIKEKINLCLGYFDGVHLGHQELIKKANNHIGVFSFEFNNVNLKNKRHLTSLEDKVSLFENLHVEYFFVLSFDEKVKNLSKEEFIVFLKERININKIIVGEDFTFGINKSGNVSTLQKYFTVDVVHLKQINNIKIGSSNIVKLIEEGNIKLANECLNRFYTITGVVEKGYQEGHKHNFPTANVSLNNYIKPLDGVYACFCLVNNKKYLGMCNVGVHPTINLLKQEILEVNIFSFNEDIYNQKIQIQFVEFIRKEKKFININELYNQLQIDKEKCLQILNSI